MINSTELQEILARLSRVDNPEPVEYLREILKRMPTHSLNSTEEESPLDIASTLSEADKTSILQAIVLHGNTDSSVLKAILEKVDSFMPIEIQMYFLVIIASNPNADSEVLKEVLRKAKFLTQGQENVLVAIASNPNADLEALKEIFTSVDSLYLLSRVIVLEEIASNPNADSEVLKEVLEKVDSLETKEDKASLLEDIAWNDNADSEVLKEILGKVDSLETKEDKASLLEDIASNDNADSEVLKEVLGKVDSLDDQWYEHYVLGSVASEKKADRNILEMILEKAPSYEDKYKKYILESVELGAESLSEAEKASILTSVSDIRSGKRAAHSALNEKDQGFNESIASKKQRLVDTTTSSNTSNTEEAGPSGRSWVSRVSSAQEESNSPSRGG